MIGSAVVIGKLAESVPEEFRELLEKVEPWLGQQPARKWSDYVVYAVDALPEFEKGMVGSRFHCMVMPKSRAIEHEEAYKTDAGRALAEIFRNDQKPDRAWLVLSSARQYHSCCGVFGGAIQ